MGGLSIPASPREQVGAAGSGELFLLFLRVEDFRCFNFYEARLPGDGIVAVRGPNGSGKTSLLEAIGYLVSGSSLRGAAREEMVRAGSVTARVVGECHVEGRQETMRVEIVPAGRDRFLYNGRVVGGSRRPAVRWGVSVFTPDSLALVKGGPSERRQLLDATGLFCYPRAFHVRERFERVLRQRNALLREVKGRLRSDHVRLLDVLDEQLGALGEELVVLRTSVVEVLAPFVLERLRVFAGRGWGQVELCYRRSWSGGLGAALRSARDVDVQRGVTTIGPQRDDLEIVVGGFDARSHCSQGQQRMLALSLCLASRDVAVEVRGYPPLLLLDDVFSELDRRSAEALAEQLQGAVGFITAADALPEALPLSGAVDLTAVEGSS